MTPEQLLKSGKKSDYLIFQKNIRNRETHILARKYKKHFKNNYSKSLDIYLGDYYGCN